MKAITLDHVSVTVSDLDGSLVFYRDLLGIRMLGTGDEVEGAGPGVTGIPGARFHYADLDLGSGQILELLQYFRPVGKRIRHRIYDPGGGHVALRVDHLPTILRKLKRAGISPRSAPIKLKDPKWWRGATCVYVEDPDGVTVELVERSGKR